ncbi:alginate lyase family protein [bacterium]|nr:alginate lyase family protein [bacterium]
MNLGRIAKRVRDLGLKGLAHRASDRTNKFVSYKIWKRKVERGTAATTWKKVSKKINVPRQFKIFLAELRGRDFLCHILKHTFFKELSPTNQMAKILGARVDHESSCRWHYDFRIKKNIPENFRRKFHRDLQVKPGSNEVFDTHNFEIKFPWELSRLQHLIPEALEYRKNPKCEIARGFTKTIESWIAKNPFMTGTNWMCTMEVAIRAVNLIWLFECFKNSHVISKEFWCSFICLLYDHLVFIESNWENSDRPNNHLLADSIGYWYLCNFLQHKKKTHKAFKQICRHFDQQLQNDGSSYESSTAYHRLITEFAIHFLATCEEKNIPEKVKRKITRAIEFFNSCTDTAENLVQIGDNDSGKLVLGLRGKNLSTKLQHKFYPDFGLSVIKNNVMHATLRHTSHKDHCPTGHKHQDALGITFSWGDTPLIVDPGSYAYTSNRTARNYFRSAEAHSTFFVPEIETAQLSSSELFTLPTQSIDPKIIVEQNLETIKILSMQSFYREHGIKLARTVIANKNTFEIEDTARSSNPQNFQWQLIFHPDVTIKTSENSAELTHKKNTFALKANFKITCEDAWHSSGYGEKSACKKLVARFSTTEASLKITLLKTT